TALYRGDCLAILPSLPAASVQLVVTSPPYNVGWAYADDGAADARPLADYLAFLREVLRELARVLRVGGVPGLNLPPPIRTRDDRAYPLGAWAQMHLHEAGWLLR